MTRNNYYVYVYLDPRKEGKFQYGNLLFGYEPFYIGKGVGNRLYKHISKYYLKKESHLYKTRRIKKLIRLGYDLKNNFITKIKENLSDQESFILEKYLIRTIGRKNLNKGPLLNSTDGGEGTSGRIVSEKEKEIHRLCALGNKNCLGRITTNEIKEKISKSEKGKFVSKETRKKISLALSGRKCNKALYKSRAEKMKGNKLGLGYKHNPETLEKIRQSSLERNGLKRPIIDGIIEQYNKNIPLTRIARNLNTSFQSVKLTLIRNGLICK